MNKKENTDERAIKTLSELVFDYTYAVKGQKEMLEDLQKQEMKIQESKSELKETLYKLADELAKDDPKKYPFKEGKEVYLIEHEYLEIEMSEGEIRSIEPIAFIKIETPKP